MKAALGSAAVLSLLLIASYTWWFQTSWPVSLAYAMFAVITLATIPLCYRFFGFQDIDVVRGLLRQEQTEHDEMISRLQKLQVDLKRLDIEEGSQQAGTLLHLLNDFHEVISNRFHGKQLSSTTYLNAARGVQNQTLQNLSDMAGVGHSIVSLQRQRSTGTGTSAKESTEISIDNQLESQRERLDGLITDNRRLFKALSDTSVEVANIEEIGAFERTETLAKLRDLAEIARQQSS